MTLRRWLFFPWMIAAALLIGASVTPRVGAADAAPLGAGAVLEGQRLTLVADVDGGTGPFTYQWYKDGVPIAGGTSRALIFGSLQLSDAGSYAVVVANEGGSAASLPEVLNVQVAKRSRVTNLSIVASGGEVAVGFALGGLSARGVSRVLARAAGPALAQFGVTGFLPDPLLKIFNRSQLIGANDNWEDSGLLGTTRVAVGAFPFPVGSKDSALVLSLPQSSYTAQVSDGGGGKGTVVVEIYDTNSVYDPFAPRLVNVSARAAVGSSDAKLVGGFTIEGEQALMVLLRGIGPSLASVGVSGGMDRPRLTLFRGPTVLAANERWADGSPGEIEVATEAVGAFALPPNSLDAALLISLAPGAYTAEVSGVGGNVGVALLEVYEVP